MKKDWILLAKETKRNFANKTWVPLRASESIEHLDSTKVGYTSDVFACGSVAFIDENRSIAEQLSWSDIGIGCDTAPYAYEDGYYATLEQYQRQDKEPLGIHLVFEYQQPVIGESIYILNPDLVVALRLIQQGNEWVRPEENFMVVAREVSSDDGKSRRLEIKREFLIDYLAARGLSLRLSYYLQRVENVSSLAHSDYSDLKSNQTERDGGRFELLIRDLEDVYGGSFSIFHAWRTDVDEDDDAPVMGPETDVNTDHKVYEGQKKGYVGVRVEGEFWTSEWIDHQGLSTRVRGDKNPNLPDYIVETDGSLMNSTDLFSEDIGRWLWFRSDVINTFIDCKGFSLTWYTSETGAINSTSGYRIHFGVNDSDLITIYACDIARLPLWEQKIWAAHNVVPDGKVSPELLDAQVKAQPAKTHAVETMLFESIKQLEMFFEKNYQVSLFSNPFDEDLIRHISRFNSKDKTSILRLAKDLVRLFSDRLNVKELRNLLDTKNKEQLGSIKLLESIVAQKVGPDLAREIFGPIVGVYELRLGDAHPVSSKIDDSFKLTQIDQSLSFLKQGKQLIHNYGYAIWRVGKALFYVDETK